MVKKVQKNAALLVFSVLAVMPITLFLRARVTTLPSPLLVAAIILGVVAVFGAIVSLLLRRRGRNWGS
jgi:hypothetical protein